MFRLMMFTTPLISCNRFAHRSVFPHLQVITVPVSKPRFSQTFSSRKLTSASNYTIPPSKKKIPKTCLWAVSSYSHSPPGVKSFPLITTSPPRLIRPDTPPGPKSVHECLRHVFHQFSLSCSFIPQGATGATASRDSLAGQQIYPIQEFAPRKFPFSTRTTPLAELGLMLWEDSIFSVSSVEADRLQSVTSRMGWYVEIRSTFFLCIRPKEPSSSHQQASFFQKQFSWSKSQNRYWKWFHCYSDAE